MTRYFRRSSEVGGETRAYRTIEQQQVTPASPEDFNLYMPEVAITYEYIQYILAERESARVLWNSYTDNNGFHYDYSGTSYADPNPEHHSGRNEDDFLIGFRYGDPDVKNGPPFFAVCDGMGAHAGSEAAAIMANQAFRQSLAHIPWELTNDAARFAVEEAMRRADQAIITYAQDNLDLLSRNIGTTAVLVLPYLGPNREVRLAIAHTGDARAYQYSPVSDTLYQHTLDFAAAYNWDLEKQYRFSEVTAPDQLQDDVERREFQDRHIVRTSLGPGHRRGVPLCRVRSVPLYEGGIVLLCSDGIHDPLTDSSIKSILRKQASNFYAAGQALTGAAKRIKRLESKGGQGEVFRGKDDDRTVLIFQEYYEVYENE